MYIIFDVGIIFQDNELMTHHFICFYIFILRFLELNRKV